MKGYLKLCLELVIHSLDCRNVAFCNWNTKFMLFKCVSSFLLLFSVTQNYKNTQLSLYPGANQIFSILCRWQRNKSYSGGWISVSLQLKIKKGGIDHCHMAAILSLLSLLRQKGCHMTKVYWGVLWLWRGGCGGEGRGKLACTKH